MYKKVGAKFTERRNNHAEGWQALGPQLEHVTPADVKLQA